MERAVDDDGTRCLGIMMRPGLLLLAASCADGPVLPAHPCHAEADWTVEITPAREPFGSMTEGGPLWCGIPPQGGAPYTPVRARVRGPDSLRDGMQLYVVATDAETGEELSVTDLPSTRMTCANVGESAGYWVGSELHLRFPERTLQDLSEREVDLTLEVSTEDGSVVIEDRWLVTLVLD